MFFSEIGEIRAKLCTIEACKEKRQVIKHLETIKTQAEKVIRRLKGDQK